MGFGYKSGPRKHGKDHAILTRLRLIGCCFALSGCIIICKNDKRCSESVEVEIGQRTGLAGEFRMTVTGKNGQTITNPVLLVRPGQEGTMTITSDPEEKKQMTFRCRMKHIEATRCEGEISA